jgi:hypothetical protein
MPLNVCKQSEHSLSDVQQVRVQFDIHIIAAIDARKNSIRTSSAEARAHHKTQKPKFPPFSVAAVDVKRCR